MSLITSLSYLSEIERGLANVSLSIINSIANALEIDLSELLEGVPKGKVNAEFLMLLQQVQNLDTNQQQMVISAIKGLLAGIEKK